MDLDRLRVRTAAVIAELGLPDAHESARLRDRVAAWRSEVARKEHAALTILSSRTTSDPVHPDAPDPEAMQDWFSGPMVTVRCLDASHARRKRRWVVSKFTYTSGVDDLMSQGWHAVAPSRTVRVLNVESPDLGGRIADAAADEVVDPDNPGSWMDLAVTQGGEEPIAAPSHVVAGRSRYRLACAVCKQTVPIRGERLAPILDLIAACGHSEISLEALASIVFAGSNGESK